MSDACAKQKPAVPSQVRTTVLPPPRPGSARDDTEAIMLTDSDIVEEGLRPVAPREGRVTMRAPFDPQAFAVAMEAALCAAFPVPRLRIDHSTTLMELVAKGLRAGRLSPQEGARVLDAELRGIEASTLGTPIGALGAMVAAIRAVVEDLGGIAGETDYVRRDAIVFDHDEVRRQRALLAVESQGHSGRGAEDFIEFAALVSERSPDAVLVALPPGASPVQFCAQLRGLICSKDLPIILLVDEAGTNLAELARETGENCLSGKIEMDRLTVEIGAVLGGPASIRTSRKVPIQPEGA
jgi:hypothetical protein